MKKLQSTAKNLWANHRIATLATSAAVLIAVVGVVGYLVLKRPGDVSNEDAAFDVADQQGKGVVGEANWPFYGLNQERTRYLAAEDLKPPYKVAWRINARKLLEYSPVLVDGSMYTINNNGEALSAKTRNGKIRWRREVATRTHPRPPTATACSTWPTSSPGRSWA